MAIFSEIYIHQNNFKYHINIGISILFKEVRIRWRIIMHWEEKPVSTIYDYFVSIFLNISSKSETVDNFENY